MLSVIVYGRNDNYAYAIERRTALGLNCLATHLTSPEDEILFVDYNTDDDLPTMAEAIADTLTDAARALIRVIRVRPAFHDAIAGEKLPVLEAVSRNIALRRANPANRWVLSTNPDCVLMASASGLSEALHDLAPGAYGLPRFELPRLLWTALRRDRPEEAFAAIAKLSGQLHLDETVRHYLPTIGFDAPGDFQLVEQQTLREIGGFNESMRLGWHIDANLSARLGALGLPSGDLNQAVPDAARFRLYHCEHALRYSLKHASGRAEDDFEHHVTNVETAALPAQMENWGAPDVTFETFQLSAPPLDAATDALTARLAALSEPAQDFIYGPESFGRLPRAPAHATTYLLDVLAHAPPGSRIGWVGGDLGQIGPAAAALNDLRLGPLLVCDISGEEPVNLPDHTAAATVETLAASADILIFDPPLDWPERAPLRFANAFAELVAAERSRQAEGAPPRRVIGLNTPHSPFEAAFLARVACAMTPVTTRLRHGVVRQRDLSAIDLLPGLRAGPAGAVEGDLVTSVLGQDGHVSMGPWRVLENGAYRLTCALERHDDGYSVDAVVEAALDQERAAASDLSNLAVGPSETSFSFTVDDAAKLGASFELRVWSSGGAQFTITRATLTPE